MNNFNTQFRTYSLFPNVISQSITIGKSSLNSNDEKNQVADKIHAFAILSLSKESTPQIFKAACALCPTVNASDENGSSILDIMINELSKIITNDTLSFIGLEEMHLSESKNNSSTYEFRAKKEKVKLEQADVKDEITDEMRDELSGANIDLTDTSGINDCGDTCKI